MNVLSFTFPNSANVASFLRQPLYVSWKFCRENYSSAFNQENSSTSIFYLLSAHLHIRIRLFILEMFNKIGVCQSSVPFRKFRSTNKQISSRQSDTDNFVMSFDRNKINNHKNRTEGTAEKKKKAKTMEFNLSAKKKLCTIQNLHRNPSEMFRWKWINSFQIMFSPVEMLATIEMWQSSCAFRKLQIKKVASQYFVLFSFAAAVVVQGHRGT